MAAAAAAAAAASSGANLSPPGASGAAASESSGAAAERDSQAASRKQNGSTNGSSTTPPSYDVEHLATFSTGSSRSCATAQRLARARSERNRLEGRPGAAAQRATGEIDCEPAADIESPCGGVRDARTALQNLFELEKLSGIWTQRMQIELHAERMLIIDCESSAAVESFARRQVTKLKAFSHYNDIYNNIIVFIIEPLGEQKSEERDKTDDELRAAEAASASCSDGELHIFQCVSHEAQQLVADILAWKRGEPVHGRSNLPIAAAAEPDCAQNNESAKQSGDKQRARAMAKQLGDERTKTLAPGGGDNEEDDEGNEKEEEENGARLDAERNAKSANGKQAQDKIKASEQSSGASGAAAISSATAPSAASKPTSSKPPVILTAAAAAQAANGADNAPIVNVNVKETVQVFNQIAALREKSGANFATSPPTAPAPSNGSTRPLSDSSASSTGPVQAANGAGKSEAQRTQLSQGAQLYKQRSIRATLAPSSPGANAADNAPSSAASTSSGPSEHQRHNGALQTDRARAAPATAAQSNGRAQQQQQQQEQRAPAGVAPEGEPEKQQQQQARHKDKQQRKPSRPVSNGGASNKSQAGASPTQQQLADQVATNESYVSVLNHCFDDIEKFIIRLQQAFGAARELAHYHKQLARRANGHAGSSAIGAAAAPSKQSSSHTKRSSSLAQANGNSVSSSASSNSSSSLALGGAATNGQANVKMLHQQQQPLPPIPPSALAGQQPGAELAALAQRARGPTGDDYFEILSKFKLAFNLLAKLKGCIHEPNAPELVHFLFTPLAIIIESARNVSPPVDPTLVGIPYLNRDALELLSNCCTSKESDLWHSLGANWTQTIDLGLLRALRLPSSFQPIFSDGWAPVISELELIGLPSAAPPHFGPLVAPSSKASSPPVPPQASQAPPLELQQRRRRRTGAAPAGRHAAYADEPGAAHYRASTLAYDDDYEEEEEEEEIHEEEGGAICHEEPIAPTYDLYAEPMEDEFRAAHQNARKGAAAALARHQARGQQQQTVRHHRSSEQVSAAGESYARALYRSPAAAAATTDGVGPGAPRPPGPTRRGKHTASAHNLAPDELAYLDFEAYPGELLLAAAGPNGAESELARRRRHAAHAVRTSSYGQQQQQQQQEQLRRRRQQQQQRLVSHSALLAAEHEQMLADLGPAQTEWFLELQARGALIVRVLFTREANNDKELSVRRGELLEVLDDSRKWWRARNIDLQAAHVPHTIVAIMDHYQTLDELLTNSGADYELTLSSGVGGGRQLLASGPLGPMAPQAAGHYAAGAQLERRAASSKSAGGAFRYF